MSLWLTVVRYDAKRIIRDPILLYSVISPFIYGLIIRWGLPEVTEIFRAQFDLTRYYPLIIVIFVVLPAISYGVAMALQILNEKVETSLLAVAVTPFSLRRYFILRIFMYTIVSIPVIVLVHMQIGIIELSALKLWAVAIVASLQVPLIALVIAGFAKNQVEGFAVMEGSGFLVMLPAAMFFVQDYWHLFCGIVPAYWPIIAYFTAVKAGGSEMFFWIAVIVGLIFQTAAVRYLYYRFERNVLGK